MSSRTFLMRKDRLTQDRLVSVNSHISALLISPRGLTVLTRWVQLWADRRVDPAFTEPWLQAKVIRETKEEARPGE